jgi:CheY-like chemotaxis protein
MIRPYIIVTNDDTTYLDMIREFLQDEGYPEVDCVLGPQAYQLIKRKRPDLVLLDIHIGQHDSGWRLLDFIRLDPQTTDIPVIICSTDPRLPREKGDWLRRQRCYFLEKPFQIANLTSMIAEIVGPPPQLLQQGHDQRS